MREQAGLSLLHVSSAWPHGNFIFHKLLKTAISIYGETQTGVKGTEEGLKPAMLPGLGMMARGHQERGWLETPLCLAACGRGILR